MTVMEDNIKVIELKNKKQKKRILNILEKMDTKNIYLLEGIISENPNNRNLLLFYKNKLAAIVHLKLNRYVHIQGFSDEVLLNIELAEKLKILFPEIRSIFGDIKSIELFKNIYSDNINKSLDYIYMELSKDAFKQIDNLNQFNTSKENFLITPDIFPQILSLQISYEIEELKVDPTKIKKEIIAKVIELRIKRNEMTVLKNGKKAIGIAAINARYKDLCQIGSVYIDKLYRGKGLGKLLLTEHLKKLFRSYNKLVLFVRKDNQVAFNLYKKFGFSVKGKLGQITLKIKD